VNYDFVAKNNTLTYSTLAGGSVKFNR